MHPARVTAGLLFRAAVAILLAGAPAALVAQSDPGSSEPSDTLRGTVVNSFTHEPIPRALVVSPDNRFATMTDDRGQFTFHFSPAAPQPTSTAVRSGGFGVRASPSNRPYQLTARKPGFLSDENAPQIPVRPDQDTLTITLVPEALVVGRIQLPSPDYLDRLQVELFRRVQREGREHWDSAGSVRSRADGTFRFSGLAAGAYKLVTQELLDRDPLTFDPRGQRFGYPAVYFPSAPDFAAAQIIQLAAGATFQAGISPARREYHRVKIGVANPPPGMQLQVSPQGHPGPGYSLAYNAEDEAVEGLLPDGAYTLRASSYGPAAMTGTLNFSVSGGPATGSTLALAPNPSLSATIREEFQSSQTLDQLKSMRESQPNNSRRPNYVSVNLIPLEEWGFTPTATLRQPTGPDDDSLVFDNVQPAIYRVQATTSIGYVAAVTSGGTDLLHKPLVVGAGSLPPPIEITLRDDGAEVDGAVDGVANDSRPIAFFGSGNRFPAVYFLPVPDSTGQFRTAVLSQDGRFQLQQLPPGGYRVLALDHLEPNLEFATEEMLAPYEAGLQTVYVNAAQQVHLRLTLARGSQ